MSVNSVGIRLVKNVPTSYASLLIKTVSLRELKTWHLARYSKYVGWERHVEFVTESSSYVNPFLNTQEK